MGLILKQAFEPGQVIETVRSWCGTPYRHRCIKKGRLGGVDCLGLVIGVYSELYHVPLKKMALAIPEYSPWWAEETGQELMVEGFRNNPDSVEIPPTDLIPGDIFVMRMKYNGPAKHCGFMSFDHRIIHAYSGHEVIETDIPPGWERRIRYGFRFGKLVEAGE